MNFSRLRLFALLLVTVFSFAAIGATSIASASDASTSAMKKSKKCKKGYKKTKGKCKKYKGSKGPKGPKGKAFAVALGSVAAAPDASAAKKKMKKCKKGYQRVGKKCKRKPFVITPDSITLVAGVLKQRLFATTGYSFFPRVTRDAVLRGYWHISNGIGYERLKVEWKVFKGQDYLNFGDLDRKVGLSGPDMTATLVVKGVRSNAYPLEQE